MIQFATSTAAPIGFDAPRVTFTPAEEERAPQPFRPSHFADEQRANMAAAHERMIEAHDAGNVAEFTTARRAYELARRSLRSHYRYHAQRFRDAAPFPISHDDHLANVAHQHRYHERGDVERMTVGLSEVSEWQPRAVRAMDAAAGVEPVAHYVPGFGTTVDWLSIAQRTPYAVDPDRDELPSDYQQAAIAEAERLGCTVDELGEGMQAKSRNVYAAAE